MIPMTLMGTKKNEFAMMKGTSRTHVQMTLKTLSYSEKYTLCGTDTIGNCGYHFRFSNKAANDRVELAIYTVIPATIIFTLEKSFESR